MSNLVRFAACFVLTATGVANAADQSPQARIDADGVAHIPALTVQYSPLAGEESKRAFLEFTAGFAKFDTQSKACKDIACTRKVLDDVMMKPGLERLRAVFPVTIEPEVFGGIQTDVILPKSGVSTSNTKRVLINLHGGGFAVGARFGGQQESVPIASLARIKVITVDYREGPENKFPAASEDVATVYRELLKQYPAKNIGIYGCSAGGMLTAESVAWFQQHSLPTPGAVGIFGAGALVASATDSNTVGAALMGWPIDSQPSKNSLPYFDAPGVDVNNPMVSPANSLAMLARFPPSLLITGTRDIMLSPAAYTHAQLIKAGVDASLHVFEGQAHCSFAQPVVDPNVPQTQEAWDVIVKFFDHHLGR